MKRTLRILLACTLGCGFHLALLARMVVPLPPAKGLPPHVIPLWNGRDLTGWKTYFTNEVAVGSVWSVRSGVLALSEKPIGYLCTEKTFSNYHLHFEWRWPQANGNSGVFLHLAGNDAIWPRSVECQLKSGSAGELVGQGGVDFPAPLINGKKRAKISNSSERAVGEWNSGDVYCRANSIEVQINGARQNLIGKVSVDSGSIGLQLEGHAIEFRNLWLEQL
jgi:hypothetical protein